MATTYRFESLDYYGSIEFKSSYAKGSAETVDFGKAVSAADVGFYASADRETLRLSALGKVSVLRDKDGDPLGLADLKASQFTFADGSKLVFGNRANGFDLTLDGTRHDDLLIGNHEAVGRIGGLVSTTPGGKPGNGNSSGGSLSGDGRWLVFSSASDNIVSNDADQKSFDVFLKDLSTGKVTLLSRDRGAGGDPWQGDSIAPCISADGSVVAFMGRAIDVQGGRDYAANIVMHLDGTKITSTEILNPGLNGGVPSTQHTNRPALSADGHYAVFRSNADNLLEGHTNIAYDVYLQDLTDPKSPLKAVAVNSNGVASDRSDGRPSISGDGNLVAFHSVGRNLGPVPTTDEYSDIFLRDIKAGTTTLLTRGLAQSYNATISSDGKFVAYQSDDSQGISSDQNGTTDIFIYSVEDQTTRIVSADEDGVVRGAIFKSGDIAGGDEGIRIAISGNGRFVVFFSSSDHLISDDTNGAQDMFVKDMQTGRIALLSSSADYGDEGSHSSPSISDDGTRISFARLDPAISKYWQTYVLDNPLCSTELAGGKGDDTYQLYTTEDTIVERAGEGTDTVRSSIGSYFLGKNLENLELAGSRSIGGGGNGDDNLVTGNAGDNKLDGRAGVDTISYANAVDSVTVKLSLQGKGQDTRSAGVDTLRNFENLTGGTFDDTLQGNAKDNVIDGGGGADALIGLAGDDTYRVDNLADHVTEQVKCGDDTVLSRVSHTLSANVEHLVLLGNGKLRGIGNAEANTIVGNDADNVIDGRGGSDKLVGGEGEDKFLLSSRAGSDTISDFISGADRIQLDAVALHIGDGDARLEQAVDVDSGGGFSAESELLVFEQSVSGRITADKAAEVIGRADDAYSKGQRVLFAVDNGEDTRVFLFTSSGANAGVSAAELELIATLDGAITNTGDYLFGA